MEILEKAARFIAERLYIVFLLFLLVSVFVNRRNRKRCRKGQFYFFAGITVFLLYCAAIFTLEGPVPLTVFPLLLAAALVIGFFTLKRFWNFRLSCAVCGGRLDFTGVLTDDSNTCADCRKNKSPAGGEEPEADAAVPEDSPPGDEPRN